jgi:hypothetical protein
MYWNSIFWIISWPVLIISSCQIIKYTIIKYESILDKPVKKVSPKV